MRPLLRRAAACAGVLGLSVTLVACGGSSGKADAPGGDGDTVECPLPALDKATGPIKVTFWYGGLVGEAKTALQKMVTDYNASQDKVVVTASDQGKDYDQSLAKYTAAIPAERIPNAVYVENNKAQFMTDSGTIIPGEACAKEGVVPLDGYAPAVKSYYTINGKFQPASVNTSGLQLYYNKKDYAKAGLDPDKAPGTIAELRADAEKLKDAGVEWPISMKIDTWFFEVWLGGMGKDMVNNDNGRTARATEAVFDTPEAVDLLTELKAMYDDGLIAKISNTPGQLNHYVNMATGKSTILMETSTAATTIKAFLGGSLTAEDLGAGDIGAGNPDVKVVPGFGAMPGIEKPGQVEVNGAAMFVTNGGTVEQQAGAMDFMRFMNQVPQQIEWHMKGSYLPSITAVAESPKVQEFWKTDLAGMSLKIASEQLAAVDPDRAGPVIGPYGEYNEIVRKMMEAIILKNADIPKALAGAQAEVTKALQAYNDANG